MRAFLTVRLFAIFMLGFVPAVNVWAQTATATLAGTVVDDSGAVIPDVALTVVKVDTAVERRTTANREGSFTFPFLPPGRYTVVAQRDGFAPSELNDVVLNVGDNIALRIALKIGAVTDEVTVVADARSVTRSPGISNVIDRGFVENQPLNGRSFQSLITLSPGVVVTSAASVGSQGQFSVNGQRPSTNYVTVDGVSANFSSSGAANLYEHAGGGLPALSALGTTTSLVSLDALQEFSIQTSAYAAEFGRQPGGQVSLITRSGTNAFHGSVSHYLRDDALDAINYFSKLNNLPKAELSQDNFGFTFGGPIQRDKTFFFVSYEGLRLTQPVTSIIHHVPSLAARENASTDVKPWLEAFPLPTGPALPTDPNTATYVGTFSNESRTDALALRLDHRLTSGWTLFGRFNHAPSRIATRSSTPTDTPNVISHAPARVQTYTAGSTAVLGSRTVYDLRVNYSRALQSFRYLLDDFGGATVPADSVLFPPFTSADRGLAVMQANPTAHLTVGLNSENIQRQWNIVNTLSMTAGAHELKFGADYRRMLPSSSAGDHRRFLLGYPGVTQVLTGNVPFLLRITPTVSLIEPRFTNFSAFIQDTWRVSDRLTLTYGLRYEVNPAPSDKSGNPPLTVTGLDNLGTMSLAPAGTPFYETTWGNAAPRVGFAYQLAEGQPLVLRGGVGKFYDLGYTFTGAALSTLNYPYGRLGFNFGHPIGAPPYDDAVPAGAIAPPYGAIFAYEPGYGLPYSWQYSVSVEHDLAGNTISASYVGSAGRDLGRVERLRNPNPNFTQVSVVRNAATSDYNALQLQYSRRLSRGFQVFASYTFGKSMDTVSDESVANYQAPISALDPELDHGPSSFDVRHAFSLATSYDIPSPEGRVLEAILGGFSIDLMTRATSAKPVNILTGTDPFGFGYSTVTRPDFVPGQEIYVDDPAAPGGWRINRNAFVAPPAGRQGNVGRNIARGFPFWQVDVGVRRAFALTEAVRLQLRLEVFNVLNRVNLADPVGVLTNANFGVSTQTLNSALAGLSPLYQAGGPRSMQLSARIDF